MIKRAVNASEDDVVIFTGSGTTGAIHKLIGVLELKGNSKNTVRSLVSMAQSHVYMYVYIPTPVYIPVPTQVYTCIYIYTALAWPVQLPFCIAIKIK